MSRRPKVPKDIWDWQQALLDSYLDHRWRGALEPLDRQLDRWKAGEGNYGDIDDALHRAHKESQKIYSFFGEKRDFLVRFIQMDREWFEQWLAAHPPPDGVKLVPPF